MVIGPSAPREEEASPKQSGLVSSVVGMKFNSKEKQYSIHVIRALANKPDKVDLLHRPLGSQPRIIQIGFSIPLAKHFSGFCERAVLRNVSSGTGNMTLIIQGGQFEAVCSIFDAIDRFSEGDMSGPRCGSLPFHNRSKILDAAQMLEIPFLFKLMEAQLYHLKGLMPSERDTKAVIEAYGPSRPAYTRIVTALARSILGGHMSPDSTTLVNSAKRMPT